MGNTNQKYNPTNWVDGGNEPINAANLNNIENGIVKANSAIEVINGSGEGSISKAVDDAKTELTGYADTAKANAITAAKIYTDEEIDKLEQKDSSLESKIDTHILDKTNPHEVTKNQIGLDKVENKTVAEIKEEFRGDIVDDSDKFVTGKQVYDYVESIKNDIEIINGTSDTEGSIEHAVSAESSAREEADNKIIDTIGDVVEGETVVDMITSAKNAANKYTDDAISKIKIPDDYISTSDLLILKCGSSSENIN